MSLYSKIKRQFYNPSVHTKRLKFFDGEIGSILLPSSSFQFYSGENQFKGKISIGAETMFGGEVIFETSEGEVLVGKNTFVNSGTKFISRSRITIGDNVTIAWGCTFYDHNSHSLDFLERQKDVRRQVEDYRSGKSMISGKDWSTVKSRPIVVKDNAWIGFDCVILSGVTIGEGAVVGACSVVRQDVEPWTVVAGNPAQVVKRLR